MKQAYVSVVAAVRGTDDALVDHILRVDRMLEQAYDPERLRACSSSHGAIMHRRPL